ncbi:hypothetical protein JCM14124_22590 [Humidesulfovibrio idahonensis]
MLCTAFGAAVFVLVLSFSAASHAEMFSSAEEFLAQDWRGGDRSGLHTSDQAGDATWALQMAVGPLPVPGKFMKAETTPFAHIPQIMGPGKESPPAWPLAEGFPGRCYVSSRGGDATALLFIWGTNDMAQCLAVFKSREMLARGVDCAPSDHVHAGLRTPEGLRLGMTRTEVEAMLGAPDGGNAEQIGYARRFRLPATKRLLRELGRKHEPGENTVLRYQQIMVWFQGGRVAGFAVEQNTHYN